MRVLAWMLTGCVCCLTWAGAAQAQPGFSGTWGGTGSGNGQFDEPNGIAIDSDGSVLVVDAGNDRVQRFSADGTYLGQFGTSGSGNGQFTNPTGIAVAPDRSVYVTDLLQDRVQRFAANGTYLGQFGSPGMGSAQFSSPSGVAVADDGTVYVVDRNNRRVQRFTANGTYLSRFGTPGSGNGQFTAPSQIALVPDGTAFVSDLVQDRVQQVALNGAYLGQFGTAGAADGQFNQPYGIALAADSSVFVVDRGNDRVQRFAADGTYLSTFGTSGSGSGQLSSPLGIAIAPDGVIYVSDFANDRLQRFGDFAGTLAVTGTTSDPVVVGDRAMQTLTLSNTGLTELPLDALTVTGSDADQFSVSGGSCASSTTLAAGTTCTIEVTVAPTRPGVLSAVVSVDASMGAWADTYTATLDVNATAAAPLGALGLGPASITRLAPAGGPDAGGTPVTVIGTNFSDDTQVWFGDIPASSVRVERYDRLIAVAPAQVAGPVIVTVSNAVGIGFGAAYTYTPVTPDRPPAVVGATTTPPAALRCIVPDLLGRTITAARQRLHAAGCALGRVRRNTSRHGAPTPRVIQQMPAAGARRPQGGRVTIITRVRG